MRCRRVASLLSATALSSFACAHAPPAPEPVVQTSTTPPPAPPPTSVTATPAPAPVATTSTEAPRPPPAPKAKLAEESIDLSEKIQFADAKPEILPASDGVLKEVLEILKVHAELRIRVEGYTSSEGELAFNTKLSGERADAVVTWLVNHGIEKTRLESKGFGPNSPIADNSTEEGREKNRRVDFKIIKKK